jgi:uncharacterized repeat protein (TIGR01451 family)
MVASIRVDQAVAGLPVLYTISCANFGPSSATNVNFSASVGGSPWSGIMSPVMTAGTQTQLSNGTGVPAVAGSTLDISLVCSAAETDTNLLNNIASATVTIPLLPSTSTPSPLPTSTATATPTPVPSSTATTTGTVTSTPTATSSATPSATGTATSTATQTPLPGGSVIREIWHNIAGDGDVNGLITDPRYPDMPDLCLSLNQLNTDTDYADYYGQRLRGYISPPANGDYTFWIASDNGGQFWLSTDNSPTNLIQRAYIAGVNWVGNFEWDVYPEQQSVPVALMSGQSYYFEALQADGSSGDRLQIAWQGPGISRQVITGIYLSSFGLTCTPAAPTATPTPSATGTETATATQTPLPGGSVLREVWNNGSSGGTVADLTSDPRYPNSPDICESIINLDTPVNYGEIYGQRLRGFITPPVTGSYTFWIASDNGSEFWLSSDVSPANLVLRAAVPFDFSVGVGDWTQFPEQQSAPLSLVASQPYYFEVLHKEAADGDFVQVAWQGPGISQQIISGAYLSSSGLTCTPAAPTETPTPSATGTETATATETSTPTQTPLPTGSALREVWLGIPGEYVSDLVSDPRYPDSPDICDTVANLESPINYGDNYGQRIRGYITPPTSGSYTFWIASDNGGDFYLSTDANPANRVLLAYVPLNLHVIVGNFSTYPEQQSAPVTLVGGQLYYFEAVQKEDVGGDFVQVAWQGPGISQQIISSAYLSSAGLTCTPAAPTASPTATPTPTPSATATATPTASPTPTALPTGGVLRENWYALTGFGGLRMDDLTNDPRYPDAPNTCDTIPAFETPFNFGDHYGQRLRALLIPPATGDYTFWLTSDNVGELFLSSDNSPANRMLIASVFPFVNTPYDYAEFPSQQSTTISLQAGQAYYIEALHTEGTVTDFLQVAWQGPTIPVRETISGAYLSTTGLTCNPVGTPTPTPVGTPYSPVVFTAICTQPDGTQEYTADNPNGYDISFTIEYDTSASSVEMPLVVNAGSRLEFSAVGSISGGIIIDITGQLLQYVSNDDTPCPSLTATPTPSATPTPTATATPTPTATPLTGFIRAINLGGPALVIDGNLWEGQDSPNYFFGDVFDRTDCFPNPMTPLPDPNREAMLRCVAWNGTTFVSDITLTNLPNGTYDFYFNRWEDTFAETITHFVQGSPVAVLTIPSSEWRRMGPYPVTVTDGTISFVSTGGNANIGGVEVWQVGTGGPGSPTSTPPPIATETPTATGTPTPTATATATATPTPTPGGVFARDIALSASCSPANPAPGSTTVCSLILLNAGTNNATGPQASFVLPSELSILTESQSTNSANVTGYSFSNFSGSANWRVSGYLAYTEFARLDMTVLVDPGVPPGTEITIPIAASISGDQNMSNNNVILNLTVGAAATPTPTPTPTATPTSTPAGGSADASLSLSASNPTPPQGSLLTLTAQLSNNGPGDVTNAIIVLSAPSGTTLVSASNGYDFNTSTFTVPILLPVETTGFHITVRVDAPPDTIVPASASVSTASSDPNSANNNPSVGFTVGAASSGSADLTLTGFASTTTPVANSDVTLSLLYSNLGPDTALNTLGGIILPAGVTFVSTSLGSYNPLLSTIESGDVGSGGGGSLDVVVRVAPGTNGQTLPIRLILVSDTFDPNMTDQTVIVTLNVQP